MFRRTKDGRERATDHPLYDLVHTTPNPEMTAYQYKETQMVHLATRGNHFSEIEIDRRKRPVALWPLNPDQMEVKRENGRLVYRYGQGQKRKVIPPEKILHIPWMSTNGITGHSPIELAREGIGLSLAAEDFGARFFSNDARPAGILKLPAGLKDQAAIDKLKAELKAAFSGKKKRSIALFEEDMTWQSVGAELEDSQYLETRIHQVVEVARIFGVPLPLIEEHTHSTYSNVMELLRSFVKFHLPPWLVRIEQATARALLTPEERKVYYFEHVVDAFLRGDFQQRMEGYAKARQWGLKTLNEIRRMENDPPFPGPAGEEILVPVNMVPASALGSEPASQTSTDTKTQPIIGYRSERRSSADARRRLGQAQRRVFADVASRIIRRERNDVLSAADKMLSARGADDFLTWLEEFYDGHRTWMAEQARPSMHSFAEVIAEEAARDVDLDPAELAGLAGFAKEYTDGFAQRHVHSSFGQLRQQVQEAEDPQAALIQRFDEWDETRPDKIAMRETVQENGAVTKYVFAAGGVLKLRWATHGKSCPICNKLNNKIVGIESNFVDAGSTLEAEGIAPMLIRVNTSHPPLHAGCDCSIEPEFG
jgi:HK97 family phage portal protein